MKSGHNEFKIKCVNVHVGKEVRKGEKEQKRHNVVMKKNTERKCKTRNKF